MSRSDASSSRLQIYGSLKGKAEDNVGHNDPQLTDLSAFLSQEELDKSVNLARQAIGHEPREERAEAKAPVASLTPSSISSASVPSSTSSSVSFSNPSPAPFAAPSNVPFPQPSPEFKELPATHTTFTSDRKMHKASTRQDNMIRNSRDSSEGFQDYNRSARNAPYGVETQSKKEFLNKAADFIEELSSLFKANSSKRVRPRACKTHRSRVQNKSQSDGTVYPLSSDNRERSVLPVEVEKERPSPAVSHQPVQLDPGTGHVEFQDCRITEEQQYDSVPQEAEEEAESFDLTDTTYPAEPVCEPPHFIQKLKSREVAEGCKVQLDCIVRGLPVPEVRWFCEGKELENSPDIQIITNGELHSLVIAEAFEEDTGRYSCFASNFYGTDSTSAEIYVEGDSYDTSTGSYNNIPLVVFSTSAGDTALSEVQEESTPVPVISTQQPVQTATVIATSLPLSSAVLPVLSAPTQTPQPESLQDLLASEGQLVVLECRVKGVPSPRVDWYREGKHIEDSPDFRILQKSKLLSITFFPSPLEEICTLVIAEVFPEDSGMFTCTANNKYGTVSSAAALWVKGNTSLSLYRHINFKRTPNHQNGSPVVVPLPDPPPNSCLKSGNLSNHKDSRSSSRVGLRVHFKLPEDEEEEQSDASCRSDEDINEMLGNKEPPPVLAKPKLLNLITSPAPLLRSTHASLMNLSAISHTFNYARPKEFIAAQTFSPVRSPSPTESPVPLLHELAAELNSSAASSPTLPPFSPPPRIFPTRVLKSPTSPPSLVSSPTPGPIQNPVAFLSSVLPSLTPSQATNSMGLPKGAPLGYEFSNRLHCSCTYIHESKELLLHDIEKKLRFRDDTPHFFHQQVPKLSNEGKTASRPLGPNIPATVINYDEVQGSSRPKHCFARGCMGYYNEYKVSNFEQRLMSEIEFRLERTPVEESDDEVQHDDVPTGKCIAPIFDKKLKNFRAMEGVPVTFSCKLVGIPLPKVYWFKDGKQILRKNTHYRKIREGDGTCALHIESTTSDDDGNYTIMAANPQGRISCSGHLIVQSGPPRNRMTPIHSQRVRTRIQEVESEQTQERFFRPHFLQAPGDMMAHEGRLCRLDCKVSGLPSPELMWLVNGKPIYPDIYHKMLVRENGIHSLVIDPLMQGDAGTYTCIASNKAGQSSFSLDLKVVEKEMKHPPQFVEKLQNMGIPEGTPVRLECRVLGMPPPVIFWKKDNETIPRTKERISMTQDATGYVCLLIQPTTKEDAGWYTVSAKNEAGIISCTCRLDIYASQHP
uniref:Myopalladin n=1 Tax=Acanthochromis polyacanthus TaxID=80966 RepID=A0A3Q1F5H5_9TELE